MLKLKSPLPPVVHGTCFHHVLEFRYLSSYPVDTETQRPESILHGLSDPDAEVIDTEILAEAYGLDDSLTVEVIHRAADFERLAGALDL